MQLNELLELRASLIVRLTNVEKKIDELDASLLRAKSTMGSRPGSKPHKNSKRWRLYQNDYYVGIFDSLSQIANHIGCTYVTVCNYRKSSNKKGYRIEQA